MDAPKFQLLTFDPFTTYSTENTQCNFLKRDGKLGLEGWRLNHENPDHHALWLLGKSAYEKLPQAESASEFALWLGEWGLFIKECRKSVKARVESGAIKIQGIDDISTAVPAVDGMAPSQVLSVVWQLANSKESVSEEETKDLFLQSFCIACLSEIDNALIGMCLDGRDAVSSTIAACEANANADAIQSQDTKLQEARKQLAAQAALSRHRNDPKQAEKKRIFKCWMEWQRNPDYYTGKADFARQMLAECEYLTSTKKIEDWCREWEKSSQTSDPA